MECSFAVKHPNATMSFLKIPNQREKDAILKGFVEDLESFTVYDKKTSTFHPAICCICDSIPWNTDWSCFVPVKEAKKLFKHSSMEKKILAGIAMSANVVESILYSQSSLQGLCSFAGIIHK
jgi:hypothetical protein